MPAIRPTRSRASTSRNPLPAGHVIKSKGNLAQLYDVGANRCSGDDRTPDTAILLTGEELDVQAKAQRAFLGMHCKNCNLQVAIWGFGAYHEDEEDLRGTLVPTFPICKGCFVYSLCNPGANWEDDAPAVRCLAFRFGVIADARSPPTVYVPPWFFSLPNKGYRLHSPQRCVSSLFALFQC